ncbi:hypothetical protein QEG98_05260 [Myxococcus sp. MxC21-1]|uniref:hypothetical protein n=1 Tax=Myxococcus sp. MxC21-1 TaxID=3041439 RepID=UPI002930A365|nr:hypothetical protein [Myxococcus sp. MxC21-1]WNZ63189.1 hypothetical protein QEG98_05260 [Myxococcus sp. MxC21-1]
MLAVPALGLGLTLVAFGANPREGVTMALTLIAGVVLLRLSRPRAPEPSAALRSEPL